MRGIIYNDNPPVLRVIGLNGENKFLVIQNRKGGPGGPKPECPDEEFIPASSVELGNATLAQDGEI